MTLYRRLTFVAQAGRIVKVFYPVFPPDRNASEVLDWLQARDREQRFQITLAEGRRVRTS